MLSYLLGIKAPKSVCGLRGVESSMSSQVSWLVGVFRPSIIQGHIRTCTDL